LSIAGSSRSGSRNLRFGAGEWIARTKALFSDQSHHAIARRVAGATFLTRVASAGLAYLSQILFARWMGRFEFGLYVYVWTWLLLLGSFAPLGLSSSAQRFIPEYGARGDLDRLRGFLAGSRWLPILFGLVVAALGAVAVYGLGNRVPSYYLVPLALVALCLPVHGVSDVNSGIARSYNWIKLATLPAYILRPVLLLGGMAAVYLAGVTPTATIAMMLAVAIYLATTAGQSLILARKLGTEIPPGPRCYDFAFWLATALPLFLVEGFYFLLSYTDVLVLDFFVGPEDVAVYYAATKTLAIVAFVYFSVSAATAHRFSEYHVSGARERLETFIGDAVRWTFWPSLIITACFLLAGKPLLNLFGAGFDHGYPWMFVLAIGLVARASVGPAERLLNMVGEQRVCAGIYATAFAVNLVLCLVLIPRIGPMGAAIAITGAMVAEAGLLFLAAKRRLGIHVFVWRRRLRAARP
jgi:O-antigen/teichoic acid export membrane protein